VSPTAGKLPVAPLSDNHFTTWPGLQCQALGKLECREIHCAAFILPNPTVRHSCGDTRCHCSLAETLSQRACMSADGPFWCPHGRDVGRWISPKDTATSGLTPRVAHWVRDLGHRKEPTCLPATKARLPNLHTNSEPARTILI
jgi:hypothetical protein